MNNKYLKINKEYKKVLQKIPNKKVYDYIISNLQLSLSSIGFSKEFTNYFINNFSNLNFNYFYKTFNKELVDVYDIGFFQKIVPDYFNKEVVKNIPKSDVILDLGCGTGILINSLQNSKKFKKLIGIDINRYKEWNQFKSNKIIFKVIKENKFEYFLKKTAPENIIITWTLHHMTFKEQDRYLKKIYSQINKGSRLIILEDSYSKEMPPKNGLNIYNSFMRFNISEKKIIMSTYDWIANRILARREGVPIPFGYRTLEEWGVLSEKLGYKVIKNIFIGFPNKRDINTPQGLLVIEK